MSRGKKVMSTIARYLSLLLLCLVIVPAAFSQSPDIDVALKQAHELYQQRKYKDCIKLLKDTAKRYPNCSSCYVELGTIVDQLGDSPGAVEALDHAVKAASDDPARADAHLARCQLLARSRENKDLAKAEQDCRETLKLAPQTGEAHFGLGLVLMRENHDDQGLPEIKAYLDGWPHGQNVSYAKKVLVNPRTARQSMAPDFQVTCEDGKTISSDELAGKVVVIDFWATWCPACREALPDLKDLVKKYPADKLMIISASVDQDANAWRDYITKKKMTWPQVLDKTDTLTRSFNVHAFPTYVVIDSDGFIRERIVGTDPQQSLAYKLKAQLKTMFENNEVH